jgi:hypothetical protein
MASVTIFSSLLLQELMFKSRRLIILSIFSSYRIVNQYKYHSLFLLLHLNRNSLR